MKLFDVYPLFDIEIKEGKGCKVYDQNGTEYIDLYGGHAVISVGHSHPRYVDAIKSQAEKLVFYSNSIQNKLQVELAEKLGAVSGCEEYSLFLVNSGAEANENALKLASFHTGNKRVISFKKSFHGRTSAAVKVTDNPKIVAPINDNIDVVYCELGDIATVEQELQKGDVCAVIIEGIQGIGGIKVPADDFMVQLRELTEKYNTVLILDEIQSGYGRSGKFFAHQYTGIKPDIITSAKGIANGYPFGAVLISPKFTATYGMLGTTFGGNHLACTAALAVLDIIEKENLIENAAKIGEYFEQAFKGDKAIKEYRGKGLMIGLELKEEYVGLRNRLLFEKHFFTGAAGAGVIRLLPSLTISQDTAESFVAAWRELTK